MPARTQLRPHFPPRQSSPSPRTSSRFGAFVSCSALLAFCALAPACRGQTQRHAEHDSRLAVSTPAAGARAPEPVRAETRDPVQLRALALVDGKGKAVTVSCISCHSLAPLATLRDQGLSVHGTRTLVHGPLKCQSCHDATRNDRLTLAGGESIAMTEALTLCAQCHGPQYRDYRRGSHGGMRGYWDRSIGPRERKHCVECHDPHSPAFRPMAPVLPPSGGDQERH